MHDLLGMNLRGFGIVLCGTVIAGAVGCGGISGGGGKSKSGSTTITPIQSTTNPPAPVNSANKPVLVKATFASIASQTRAVAGDKVTVTFNKEVKLTGNPDPANEFVLPVNGNTFGVGATMGAGTAKTDVVILLGTDANLRISGMFDVAFVGSGDATGIDLPLVATGNISNATTGDKAAKSKPVDLDGTLTEGWKPAAGMQFPRGGHTATLLKDGRILIVGGLRTGMTYSTVSEIYDPIANTFTSTTDPLLGGPNGGLMLAPVLVGGVTQGLPVARTDHTATLLDDGTVLICGGFGFERLDPAITAQPTPLQEDLRTAHIFDPTTNKFTLVQGTLNFPRSLHYAVKLSNGQVLVTGGMNGAVGATNPQPLTLPVAETYDPTAKTFTRLSTSGLDMVIPRMAGVAAFDKTANGVVFSGGMALFLPQGATTSVLGLSPGAETYDETAKKFSAVAAAPPKNLRYQALAVDGKGQLVITGGSGTTPANVDVVIETGNAFAAVGSLATARARASSDTVGGNIVLVAGGSAMTGQPNAELASVEVVNTETKTVQKAPAMQNARNSFTLTTVGDRVYAIGGFNASPGQFIDSSDGTAVSMAEVYSRP
ncbi:MAG: hypothetical protein ACAI25_03935 [Planctomycetota bacterium]